MALPAFLKQHTIQIEAFSGEGGAGPVYDASVTVKGFVDFKRRLIRNPDGSDLISSATIYIDPGVTVTPESRITYGGRVMRVVDALERDGGSLPVPDHIEVLCE